MCGRLPQQVSLILKIAVGLPYPYSGKRTNASSVSTFRIRMSTQGENAARLKEARPLAYLSAMLASTAA